MKAMDFYIGIDFGTTNSVIARGGIDAHSRRILPEVIHIDMDGANTPQQIVPSAALYERGKRECLGIGPAARNELMFPDPTRDQVTVSSVKLLLGQESVPDAPWLKPEEVASDILTFMRRSFEQQFNLPPVKKAVLGIPACAPPDMCERTITAARLAGFEDVTLLVEPQAALLDFVLDQSKWEESYQVVDLSSPKLLLVFDLGGGTLDVSVVRVSQERDPSPNSSIQYEELGLSRFADVGGDLFDGYLTSHLKEVFRSQTGLDIDDIPDVNERYRTNAKLRSYAEAAKQHLTRAADRIVKGGQATNVMDALNKTSHKIAIKDLVTSATGSLGFLHTLRYLDYVQAVEPLLGFGHNLSSLHDDSSVLRIVGDDNQRNIVRPVFDALLQAKHALRAVPKVDAVLLNGGMVRVHIVRERLKHLFGTGCPFFEVPSPDLSVARGAVVHNYNITKRLNRSINILSEGVWLEVQGSYLELVREGTEYPTETPIRHERTVAIPKDGATHINLPLYRGKAGVRTPISERMIDLRGHSVRKGDVLDLQVSVDRNRMLKFEAWLHNSPSVRFDVAVGI